MADFGFGEVPFGYFRFSTSVKDSQKRAQVETAILQSNSHNIHSQAVASLSKAKSYGCQVELAQYAIDRPRILYNFPSRGLSGENWEASSTEPGDFEVSNLNSDVEDEYYRSASGVTDITLTMDSEVNPGIYVDCIAFFNHNLTTSATLIIRGIAEEDGNRPQSAYATEIRPKIFPNRLVYVSPDLPLWPYKNWTIEISDPTNPDGYIKIGSILMGSALVLENEITDRIKVIPKEHKDEFITEGYTSIAQSKRLSKSIRVSFKKVDLESSDYHNLQIMFEEIRTTLKALWIFDARTPTLTQRFTVFGKLKNLPEEPFQILGPDDNEAFVDFSVEIDGGR